MPHRVFTSVIALLCMLTACSKQTSTSGSTNSVDLSSPKAALKSYGEAMKRGDPTAARQAVTGADPKSIEALAELGGSRNRLSEAAVAKFGDAGKTIAGGGEESYGQAFDKMLDDAEVKVEGETATVIQKTAPAETEPASRPKPLPLKLRKVDGNWKVDYAAMPNTRNLDLLMPIMRGIIKANDEVAVEIKEGKYATLSDARSAHQRLMNAVLTPPATQPTGVETK